MKLKGCLTAVGLILIALVGISFFLPKDMNMEVTKQLKASPEQVFAQVNNLKNWENWSPWNEMDPNMQMTFAEKYIGEGASYTWTSEKKGVGNGAMFIDESIPNEKVATTIKFEGMDDDGHASIFIKPDGEGSSVTWDFSSNYGGSMPWSKFGIAMGRMMLKKAYVTGLGSIDNYVAANPDAHLAETATIGREIVIIETEMKPFNCVTVNRKGQIADMAENGHAIYTNAFEEVGQLISEAGQTIVGMPFTEAISWNEEAGTYEVEIGMPVSSGGRVISGGKCVKASYYGPYDGVSTAHEAIDEYINNNGLEVRGAPLEIYANDPGDYPDPADWLTEVYYPVN